MDCVPLDDELFDYPFLYAVEVGRWDLDEEAARLREYLLRGGFLMVDDFHGSVQWESFMESMRRVFPDREVVEIPDDHEVFHVVCDLDHKVQIPGIYALMSGRTYEQDGVEPHWRGVFDDDGPPDGGHQLQHGPGRCLGTRRHARTIRSRSPRWPIASASTTRSTR